MGEPVLSVKIDLTSSKEINSNLHIDVNEKKKNDISGNDRNTFQMYSRKNYLITCTSTISSAYAFAFCVTEPGLVTNNNACCVEQG